MSKLWKNIYTVAVTGARLNNFVAAPVVIWSHDKLNQSHSNETQDKPKFRNTHIFPGGKHGVKQHLRNLGNLRQVVVHRLHAVRCVNG